MEQSVTKNLANADVYKVFQAPRVGLEPTTPRLTAACSTIELSRIILFSCTFSSVCDRVVALPLSYRGLYYDLYWLSFPILKFLYLQKFTQLNPFLWLWAFLGQALDLLVAVSCIHCCTSAPALSTSSSSRGLTPFGWEFPSWGGLHA